MPLVDSNTTTALGDDYMEDDLFDYNAEIPDIDISTRAPTAPAEKKDTLGIDEEVKIRRKRVTVKLDEERLMSSLGIPKLRQDAPRKLKFKGKGHEYRDTARLLSYYQFWADDLYKKAKFRDTLKIIEKLGHSKSMRDQRLNWIEESKRKERLLRVGAEDRDEIPSEEPRKDGPDNQDDSDLYSFPQQRVTGTETQGVSIGQAHANSSGALFLSGSVEDGSDDEDFGVGPDDEELDALMNMERATTSGDASLVLSREAGKDKTNKLVNTALAANTPLGDDFEDEMEVMADFGPPPDW